MCVVQYACMQTEPTDLQWRLPILIFAGLIFALFSIFRNTLKLDPREKKGFTACYGVVYSMRGGDTQKGAVLGP